MLTSRFGGVHATLVLCVISQTQPVVSDRLYFLNQPEIVRHRMILGESHLAAGEHARLFFHHVNRTKQTQSYRIAFSPPLWNVITGICVAKDPGIAGATAMYSFMVGTPRPQLDELERRVKAGQTVSGLIDGYAKTDTQFVCRMGYGATDNRGDCLTLPYRVQRIYREVTSTHPALEVRLGDRERVVKGEYGVTFHIEVKVRTTRLSRLNISVSPRGGGMRFDYRLDGKVSESRLLPVYAMCRLRSVWVKPGQTVVLDHIPTGGFNLPVVVLFRLVPV